MEEKELVAYVAQMAKQMRLKVLNMAYSAAALGWRCLLAAACSFRKETGKQREDVWGESPTKRRDINGEITA